MEMTDGLERTSPSRQSEFRRHSSSARSSFGREAASPLPAFTGTPATLHLEKLWIRDVLITTGLVDTSTTPKLLAHRGRPTRPHGVRDAPVLARRDHGRLRRVRRCGGDKRAEGGPRGQ